MTARFPMRSLVALTERAAAWCPSGEEWSSTSWRVDDPAQLSLDRLCQQLPATTEPRNYRWVLDSSLAAGWLQTPPPGIRSLTELHAISLATASQRLDRPGAVAHDHCLAADWSALRPFPCWSLRSDWHGAMRSLRINPLPLSALVVDTVRHLAPPTAWVASLAANNLLLLHQRGRQIAHWAELILPANASAQERLQRILTRWQQERIRSSDTAEHAQLHVLDVGPQSAPQLPVHPQVLPLENLPGGAAGLRASPADEAQAHALGVARAAVALMGSDR